MRSPFWRWMAGSLFLLLVDRLLKQYVTHSLPTAGVFWIPGWLELVRFQNPGIAFSLPMNRFLVLGATVILLLWISTVILRKYSSATARGSLVLLLLGAGSNFFDRLVYGSVIDYLRLGPWSLVNIADGMILVALATLFAQTTRHAIKKEDGEPSL